MTTSIPPSPGHSWAALIHTPGPSATSPFSKDPRFTRHIMFLRSLAEKGWLVAAGSFTDEDGEGMTVVRFPDSVGIAEVERLARADEAVTSGLFEVRVRPWHVALAGI